jgi:hypothetical protein
MANGITYHILNGDALFEKIKASNISGEVVVCRECLVEGDVSGDSLGDFYHTRAKYLESVYHESEGNYFKKVVSEFEKIREAPDGSEFNLWFGYDLFCNVNMWFVISLIGKLNIERKVFIVYPSYLSYSNIWKDFGTATTDDLHVAFRDRIFLSDLDIKLGEDLWKVYRKGDLKQLNELSSLSTTSFPYLNAICNAHIERFPPFGKGRPEKAIQQILKQTKHFPEVFNSFTVEEGIYGFGDHYVQRLYLPEIQSPEEM